MGRPSLILGAALAIGSQHAWAIAAADATGTSDVSFTRDVAPIVFEKCSCCHHPGEAAPISLLNYDDVRRRARQIVDVTQKRFMPPWLPSDAQHEFVGTRRL